MVSWTTLPQKYSIKEVTAALNVVVSAVSFLAVFVFTRCCWQYSARKVAKQKTVAISSLFSINTLGEAYEAIMFLNSSLKKHSKILVQAIFVALFAFATIFSGPIVKWSTRSVNHLFTRTVDGRLCGRTTSATSIYQVEWNNTIERLEKANFPIDQLLDYVPDVNTDWVYLAGEWNNSWSMKCMDRESTSLDVTITDDDCGSSLNQIGADTIREIFPKISDNHTELHRKWATMQRSDNSTHYPDGMGFFIARNRTEREEVNDESTYTKIEISIAVYHFRGIPRPTNSSSECSLGKGRVDSASFSAIDCVVQRLPADKVQNVALVANPDNSDSRQNLISSYDDYFRPPLNKESQARGDITPITSYNLKRFYQAYMAVKDTARPRRVQRKLSVALPTVQVSNVFLALFAFFLVFVICGGIYHIIFLIRYRKFLATIPHSKLDWVLHTIHTRGPPADGGESNTDEKAPSAPGEVRVRDKFSTAVYDGHMHRADKTPQATDVTVTPAKTF